MNRAQTACLALLVALSTLCFPSEASETRYEVCLRLHTMADSKVEVSDLLQSNISRELRALGDVDVITCDRNRERKDQLRLVVTIIPVGSIYAYSSDVHIFECRGDCCTKICMTPVAIDGAGIFGRNPDLGAIAKQIVANLDVHVLAYYREADKLEKEITLPKR